MPMRIGVGERGVMMSEDNGMIILRIPIELREAFIGLLEHNLDDLLNYFGADLSEDEIRVAELLQEFIVETTAPASASAPASKGE
jgi:hypothetical protein